MNHWKPLGLRVTLVVNFVKIVTMFVNLDFIVPNLLWIFWHMSLYEPGTLHIHLQL